MSSSVDNTELPNGNSENICASLDNKEINDLNSNNLSGDSDNESLNNRTINSKNKKKHNLIDSESEDESSTRPEPNPNPSDSDVDADAEKDKLTSTPDEFHTPQKKKKSRLRKINDDSDSDNGSIKSDQMNSFKETNDINESKLIDKDNEDLQKSRLNRLVDSDSEDESKLEDQINNEHLDEDALQKEQAIRLKTICDSESSADETETQNDEQLETSKKRKSKKKEPLAEKKMTGRDAVEQMRQIKSESQKMVRESRVSLPYHLPKQHTLQEFLKRRSLVPDVIDVPVSKSTTFAIKMSSQELVRAAERLKEREKEIEEFYKDESEDSENEVTEEKQKEKEDVEEKNTESNENNEDKPLEEKNETMENSSKDIIEEIDSILEPEKPSNAVEVEVQPSEEKTQEESSKIEELRNVLIQYSCGNDSNMEQLVEQPEQMETEELPQNPEDSEPTPQDTEQPIPDETENKIEEAPEDFTETFTRLIEKAETPQETPNKEDELEKKLKNLNPIISLKKDFKPRLTGDGGDFIVLDDGLERSKGVSNLMKRFLLHTSNKSTPKKETLETTEVTILHQEIEMEHEPDEAAKKNLTPGLKFKKLKANLEEQIVLKRLEEWKKKQEETKMEIDVYAGEKTECGLDEKILDEEDISEEESSEDSEEEEDDVVLEDKPKVKSAFVDEEAEESDPESDNKDEDEDSEDHSDESEGDDPIEDTTEKKPLKRIIQTFEEDSDDDENKENCPEDGNDEEITAYQPQRNGLEKTPCKPISENKNDLSTFLTPTFHLTALQGMASATKSLNESPGITLSPDPSPLRMPPSLKTKLFTDSEDVNLEELENLCSGKFTGATQDITKQRLSGNKDLTTQENDLLNLCSGKFEFTGLAAEPPQNPKAPEEPEQEEEPQFQITFDNDSLDEKLSESTRNSQNSENTQQNVPEEVEVEEEKAPKLNVQKFVIASSDEEEEAETKTKKKKSKTKKRYIIDDISISEDEDTANQDDFSDEETVEEEEELKKKNVDYDSEENEVEYEEMEADAVTVKKARDFFEAEAELSGSDWDSADEDEKGLDTFEAEDGDADKISEKKLQRELGRIHAHTVLEEDKRDVRLLQELLLEDGELHGAGREKKFKWKNADSVTWNDENRPKDDEDEIEEAENELEWRKMRHEREMFLKQQQAKQQQQHQQEQDEYENLLANDSQVMQLGREALEKCSTSSNSQQKTPIAESMSTDTDIKLPFTLTHKRGSFLMRSETTLARLAEITRTTSGALGTGPKNSRNFVFTTIDKTETLIVEESREKKRKAEPGTPKILKKMRVAESPAPQKNKKLFKQK